MERALKKSWTSQQEADMRDDRKTKAQLIAELAELRQRVTELEAVEAERVRAEEALRESEREKALILDSVSEIINYNDTNCRVKWINRAGAESVDAKPEDLTGRHCYEIWAERSEPCEGCPVVEAMETGEPQVGEMTTPDGRVWLVRGSPVRDENDEILGAVETTLEITERVRAEEKLRESEEQLKAIFDGVGEGIALIDVTGKVVRVNKRTLEVGGYTEEEIVGKRLDLLKMFPPQSLAKMLSNFATLTSGQETPPFEIEVYTKAGERLDVELRGSLLTQRGKTVGMVGVMRDITERVRAEETLRESEASYRELADSIADVFFAMDKDLRYTYWNRASEELTGIPAQDAIRKSLYELFPDTPQTRKAEGVYRDVLRTQRPQTFVNEYQLGGKDLFFEISAYPSKNGISVFTRDVTERKRTDEALRESEELLSNIVESMSDGIMVLDRDFHYTYWNRAMEVISKVPREELVGTGKRPWDVFPHLVEQRLDEMMRQAMRGEVVQREDIPYQLPDGTRGFTSEVFIPLRNTTGEMTGVVGVVRDVTERVQAEETIRQRTAQLEALRETGLELTAQLDLDALLHSIVSRAMDLIEGAAGSLYLHRPEQDALEVATAVGDAPVLVESTLRRGEGLAGKVWETGEPLAVDDYRHWEGRGTIHDDYAFTAVVGAPIRWGAASNEEEFLGVLDVLADAPRTFSPADTELLGLFATQAAIAIRNARLYEEVRRRGLEQETVSHIARALNTLDVRDAFPVLAEGLHNLTACDGVSLALLDEAGENCIMSTLKSPFPDPDAGGVIPLSATAAAKDVLAGHPHLTADLSAETDLPVEQALYLAGIRSRVNLPLLVGEEVIGALNLNSRQPDLFREDQLPLLQQVADALAGAVENSRLFEAEQRQRQEADTLREAALTLTTALDRDEVVDRILAQLQKVVPYDSSTVQLLRVDPEPGRGEDRLEIVGGRGFPNLSDLLGLSFSLGGDNPNSEVVHTRAPFIVADAPTAYGDFRCEPHAQAGIRSWMGVPILVGERLVGMIALDKREPGFYTQKHARLAEAFAAQAAVAVENARLFHAEREQRELAEALAEATAAVGSTLDLDQVLAAVLEEVRGLLDVTACSVWLLASSSAGSTDPETDELICQQAIGPQSEIVRGWRLAPGEGIAGWVARTGESLIVPDVRADERHFKGVDERTGLPSRSILSVPLRAKDSVTGVLQVVDAEVDRFKTRDQELLEPLVAAAAIAIENARLYEQARQDAKTRSILLQEVNHRVKNNLTGIIGLLYSARSHARVEDRTTYQSTMNDLIGRVRGLATVHSMLSASEWTPLRLSDLAAQVINGPLQALPRGKRMSVDVSPSPVRVTPEEAHNLALVVHELTTNAVKYALGERDTAHITFQIVSDDDAAARTVRCEFRDDGPGYPEDVLRLERYRVGFDLIQNIVRGNLRGRLSLYNDHGSVATIQFKARLGTEEENGG
jgi:PAS domain S-box-containing protein